MKISQLFVYPLKSGQGISVKEAKLDKNGFEFDRFWIVAQEKDGEFHAVTQREHSSMVLVKPKVLVDPLILVLNAPGMNEIRIPFSDKDATLVTLWDTKIHGFDQGDAASEWLSTYLGILVRLHAKNNNLVRELEAQHTPSHDFFSYTPQTAYADGFPFLVLSEESVSEIAATHPEPNIISVKTFRPNIVVHECSPYEEDSLIEFEINSVIFYGLVRCTRCVMTNNNPETGIPNNLTLKTLMKSRRVDPGAKYNACVGLNVAHNSFGKSIAVGDDINVLKLGSHDRRGIWNLEKSPKQY